MFTLVIVINICLIITRANINLSKVWYSSKTYERKGVFWLNNRVITGLIFMLFDGLQQIVNHWNVMKINPVVTQLSNQNIRNVKQIGKVKYSIIITFVWWFDSLIILTRKRIVNEHLQVFILVFNGNRSLFLFLFLN